MPECVVCDSTRVRDSCASCGEYVCIDCRENLCTNCGRTSDFTEECHGQIGMVCELCQELYDLTNESSLDNCHDYDQYGNPID